MPTLPVPVGAKVRSFDFPDSPERALHYVEGKVVAILKVGEVFAFEDDRGIRQEPQFHDCDRYAIRVSAKARSGVRTEIEETRFVFPPLNGTRSWLGGVTNGVEVVA
jgi:hypothetical protein